MANRLHPHTSYLPDGGWGWMVVFGCAIHTFVGGGLQRNFSLIFENMRDRFDSNAADTAWVYSINSSVSLVFAPLTAALVTRIGCRVVVMTGGVLVTLGILGMAFAPSLTAVYLSFGLLSGIGNGLIQCPKFIAISLWFEHRRGRATSLAMTTDGCGALLMAPLLQAAFHFYGYSGALVILAGLTLQYTVGGATLRGPFAFELENAKRQSLPAGDDDDGGDGDINPIRNIVEESNMLGASIEDLFYVRPLYSRRMSTSMHMLNVLDNKQLISDSSRHKSKSHGDIPSNGNHTLTPNSTFTLDSTFDKPSTHNIQDTNSRDNNQASPIRNDCRCEHYFNYKLLKDIRYLSFNILAVCLTLSVSMINTHFAGFCKERGVNATQIVTLLALMGGVSTTFKLLSGFLFDWPPVKRYRTHIFCLMTCVFGLMQLLSPYTGGLVAFYIVWCIYMAAGAIMATQESVILADLVDRQAFASGIGLNRFFRSFGVLVGPTFGGYLKDVTAMYDYTFIFGGALVVLAGVLLEVVIWWSSRTKRRTQYETKSTSIGI